MVIGRSSAGIARSDRVDDGRVSGNPSPTALSGGRQSLEAERRPDMTLGIQPKSAWPEALRHPEVRGVFIGGCVARGVGSSFRAKAHAHTYGAHRGWICFRSARWLGCRALLLHELAHVVTREGHTRRWRAFLLQIGGTLDEVPGVLGNYHPRPRIERRPAIEERRSVEIAASDP